MTRVACVVCLSMAVLLVVVAAAPDDVGALLAKPVSPGALALLIDHTKDPRVSEHWLAALSHADPQVRAVAARLLLLNDQLAAAADLRRALSTETNEEAAIEQARALLALGGPEAGLAVRDAAQRLGLTLPAVTESSSGEPPTIPELPRRGGPIPTPEFRVVRTIGALPRGLVADVLKLTGCKPGDGPYIGGAVVRYDEGGGLQQVAWNSTRAPKPCAAAARYLTAASLLPAPRDRRPSEPQLILLPLHDTFLTCIDRAREPAGPAPAAVRVDMKAGIPPPPKVRDVKPAYPASSFGGRKEGIVVLDTTISAAGCVSRVEVMRSSSMDLDVSAIRAVTGWVFKPTVVKSVDVPLRMTITVSFSTN